MKPLPRKTPHLDGARKLQAHPGQKLCMHLSAAFVMDVPGAEFVCATFRAANDEEAERIPNASREPFIHAWAEWQGKVWSATALPNGGAIMPRDAYYAVNGATDIKRLSRPALLKVAREIGLSRHLRLGVPAKASVGPALLDAAGKAYRVEGTSLLPPLEAGR